MQDDRKVCTGLDVPPKRALYRKQASNTRPHYMNDLAVLLPHEALSDTRNDRSSFSRRTVMAVAARDDCNGRRAPFTHPALCIYVLSNTSRFSPLHFHNMCLIGRPNVQAIIPLQRHDQLLHTHTRPAKMATTIIKPI